MNVEKPGASTVTVYWPGARPEITYCPEASDVPVRLTPAADVTVNEAWGMTAPLGSATWPRSVPTLDKVDPAAVWARPCCHGVTPAKTKKAVRQRASNRFKGSPLNASVLPDCQDRLVRPASTAVLPHHHHRPHHHRHRPGSRMKKAWPGFRSSTPEAWVPRRRRQ